jgi:hypothetical protein
MIKNRTITDRKRHCVHHKLIESATVATINDKKNTTVATITDRKNTTVATITARKHKKLMKKTAIATITDKSTTWASAALWMP